MQLLCGGLTLILKISLKTRQYWEQILHYIYIIFMCKDDENNLDFSFCFNWED